MRFVHAKGLSTKPTLRVRTVNNTLELRLADDGRVTVDMNRPVFDLAALPFDGAGLRGVGALLLWHAGRLQRHDAAIGGVREPL